MFISIDINVLYLIKIVMVYVDRVKHSGILGIAVLSALLHTVRGPIVYLRGRARFEALKPTTLPLRNENRERELSTS